MEEEKDKENFLFEGWEDPSDISFLETTKEPEPEKEEKPAVEKEEELLKKEKPVDTPPTEEINEDTIFEEFENFDNQSEEVDLTEKSPDKEDKEKKSEVPSKKPEQSTNISALNLLKERGLVEFELDEGQELTEEIAENLIEDSFEDRIEGRISEIISELPDVVKELVKFSTNGGDPNILLGLSNNFLKGFINKYPNQ